MRILFLVFFLPTVCAAQVDWAPVGAKWWYGSVSFSLVGPEVYYSPVHMEVVGDTIIQNRSCSEVSLEEIGCSICGDFGPCFVYSDSSRVYYYNVDFDQFFLLYDMNKGIGESWEVHYTPYDVVQPVNSDYFTVTVMDTMSVVVNDIRLRQQRVSVEIADPQFWSLFGDTITERVGGDNLFFPIRDCVSDVGFGGLRCYQDSLIGMYHYSTVDCEYTNVGMEEREETDVKIWPNPATETIAIETKQGEDIRLYDMTGREVYQHQASAPVHTIDMSGLPIGLYLLQVTDRQGLTSTQRVVRATAP